MPKKPAPKLGRPPKYPEGMRKHDVSLTDAQVDYLRELGEGNLSRGVRRAAIVCKDRRWTSTTWHKTADKRPFRD